MNTLSWVRSSGLSALVSASCSVSQQHNSSSTCTLSAEETWWALLNLHRASQDIRRCQVAKQELSQPMMHRLGFLLCRVVFLLNSLQQPALSLAPRSVQAASSHPDWLLTQRDGALVLGKGDREENLWAGGKLQIGEKKQNNYPTCTVILHSLLVFGSAIHRQKGFVLL